MKSIFELVPPPYIDSDNRYQHPKYPEMYTDDNGGFHVVSDNPERFAIYRNVRHRPFVGMNTGKGPNEYIIINQVKFVYECYHGVELNISGGRGLFFEDFNIYNYRPTNLVLRDKMSPEWIDKYREFYRINNKEVGKRIQKYWPNHKNWSLTKRELEDVKKWCDLLGISPDFIRKTVAQYKELHK